MVNKTKETAPAQASKADNPFELVCLKLKNQDLAKKLAEIQKNYSEIVRERDYLQQALFNEKKKTNTYINKMQDIQEDYKNAITHMVNLSGVLTTVLGKISNVINIGYDENITTPTKTPQQQKTKAVKPMVSGCTISKPTIKLSRISDQLLQATINGESRDQMEAQEEEQQEAENVPPLPFVNLTRLAPRRYNLEEVGQINDNNDDDEEEELAEDERMQEQLSTISERTETGNSRTLQALQETSIAVSPRIESPAILRFTSTPLVTVNGNQDNSTSEPSTSGTNSSNSNITNRTSLFVTKRSRRLKSSLDQSIAPSSPKRTSKKFSPGSPRVVLKRMSNRETKVVIKQEIKTEKISPMKRTKRSAASKVTCYKEPSLGKKLRRSR